MSPVFLGVVLFALLVVVGAAFLWQETRPEPDPRPVYVMRDAAEYVMRFLDAGWRDQLTRSDVQRMLEWELQYVQDPQQSDAGGEVILGGYEAAVFIQHQSIRAGRPYDGPLIEAVLALEGDYLASIGAVGGAAGASGRGDISRDGSS